MMEGAGGAVSSLPFSVREDSNHLAQYSGEVRSSSSPGSNAFSSSSGCGATAMAGGGRSGVADGFVRLTMVTSIGLGTARRENKQK